jgi:hypothetical protein
MVLKLNISIRNDSDELRAKFAVLCRIITLAITLLLMVEFDNALLFTHT